MQHPRFRSTAEKEFRRLDSRTLKQSLPAIHLLPRLEERKDTFLRRMSHHRFSALFAKKSETVESSKSMTLKFFFDFSQIIRNFPSLGVVAYNNRALNGLRVSDCTNKIYRLYFNSFLTS